MCTIGQIGEPSIYPGLCVLTRKNWEPTFGLAPVSCGGMRGLFCSLPTPVPCYRLERLVLP